MIIISLSKYKTIVYFAIASQLSEVSSRMQAVDKLLYFVYVGLRQVFSTHDQIYIMAVVERDEEDPFAYKLLEEVQHFLESKGHLKEAITLGSIVDNVSNIQLAATGRQTTLGSATQTNADDKFIRTLIHNSFGNLLIDHYYYFSYVLLLILLL